MGVLRNRETEITKNLNELEKNLGVDLKLNADGDLEVNNLNDIKLIAGAQNAAQAVRLKLFIEPGGILHHPEIGTDLQIGEKTRDAFAIKAQILKSILLDERFENADARVVVEGSTIFVDLIVTLANTGIEVPFQFSVTNQG